MAFKTQSDDQDTMSEINVTPLVDVMLVLVIILLVTAPLLTQSVHVTLPKTVKSVVDIEKQPFQLGIYADGKVTLNKTEFNDLVELENTLKTEFANNPEMVVHIHADKVVEYGKVAKVMATVQHVGISKLAFVTMEE